MLFFSREATSEIYGPWVYFLIIYFQIYFAICLFVYLPLLFSDLYYQKPKDTSLNFYHGNLRIRCIPSHLPLLLCLVVQVLSVNPSTSSSLGAALHGYTVPKLHCLGTKKRSGNRSSSAEELEGVVGLLGAADGIRLGSAALAAREHQDPKEGAASAHMGSGVAERQGRSAGGWGIAIGDF